MRLQTIIFPKDDLVGTNDLYFLSTKEPCKRGPHVLEVPPDTEILFGTYFNSFCVNVWKNYTDISQLQVLGRTEGACTIQLFWVNGMDGARSEKLLKAKTVEHNSDWTISVPEKINTGFLYIKVLTYNTKLIINDIYFEAVTNKRKNISIALVTCTFQREEAIKKNVQLLSERHIRNTKSHLHQNLEIFVIDNGKTLKRNDFPSDKEIHLIPNENTGGTGGFTKGIIEVVSNKQKECFSHILLMDDDVLVTAEALERTWALLALLKDDYEEAFVGGAMLRSDIPYILEEVGAKWDGRPVSLGNNIDLRTHGFLDYRKFGEIADYNAWWYCCMPISKISKDNLPLPFFIHGDDIEYGLRNCKNLILLNGICVWHETFENKRSSMLEYYDIRNYLIINSIYRKRCSVLKLCFSMLKRFTANIMRMRYKDIELGLEGIKDFLQGPDWWFGENILEKHKQISKRSYKFEKFDYTMLNHYQKIRANLNKGQRWFRILTLNGALLPAEKEILVVPCGTSPFAFYRIKEAYLTNANGDLAIHVTFSLKKLIKAYMKIFPALVMLCVKYRGIGKRYGDMLPRLGSWQYWVRFMS